MKSNQQLQVDVQNAIKWEPLLKETTIKTTANEGVVTLSGEVDSYSKKIEAENAVKKVIGVKAIVEKIEVKFENYSKRTNEEIAKDVLKALDFNWTVPNNEIIVKVEDGWVTLEGELHWNYQKEAAKKAVNYLLGVKGVTNNIIIKSQTHDTIEKVDVEAALRRSLSVNDCDIKVFVSGTTVTLSGNVNSWYQKDEASRIAWNAPGIWNVKNELTVDYQITLIN